MKILGKPVEFRKGRIRYYKAERELSTYRSCLRSLEARILKDMSAKETRDMIRGWFKVRYRPVEINVENG